MGPATKQTLSADVSAAEKARSGVELRDEFQVFLDRYEEAVRTGDAAVLARVCPGSTGGGVGCAS